MSGEPTVEELEAMLAGGDPFWRLMPCFLDPGPLELEQGKALLRRLLDDPEPAWTIDGRDEGCARLRWMAQVSPGCRLFRRVAAELLSARPASTRLLLGWSYRA